MTIGDRIEGQRDGFHWTKRLKSLFEHYFIQFEIDTAHIDSKEQYSLLQIIQRTADHLPAHQQQCLLLLDNIQLKSLLVLLLFDQNIFDALFPGELLRLLHSLVVTRANLISAGVTFRSGSFEQRTSLIHFHRSRERRKWSKFSRQTWNILNGILFRFVAIDR